jgi:hypothetical protein
MRSASGSPRFGFFLIASLGLAGCGGSDDSSPTVSDCISVVEARDCAATLASADSLVPWPDDPDQTPVLLYVDRSGSIRGFLDPSFPQQANDYRAVINGLVVGLDADSAFSFGSRLQRAPLSNRALHERSFYDDGDTRMEEAFARVAADTGLSASHVLVGDGRRGGTAAANGQFSDMRSLAKEWIDAGGTFVVAASLAPFRPVAGDPAGCDDPPDAEGIRASCPLYAFAFIAPGAEVRVSSALESVFEHLFAWPVAAVRRGGLGLRVDNGSSEIAVHPTWAAGSDGSVIARAAAPQAVNSPLRASLLLSDTTSTRGRLETAILRGQELVPEVAVRRLALPPQEWVPAPAAGSLVRTVEADPLALDLLSHGAASPGYLYRIDLLPQGVPSWLEQFDATSASDDLRTFGLRWLFTGFQAEASAAPPVGRVFIASY